MFTVDVKQQYNQPTNTWQLRNSRNAYARILKLYMWHADIWHKVTDLGVDELINFQMYSVMKFWIIFF